MTYNATDEELADCGLDEPQLTVTVDYTGEDEDGAEASGTFVLHISRDPEELAQAQADEESGSEETEDTEEEITAYARVGDSQIVYQLSGSDYEALMAASYDELRHQRCCGPTLPALPSWTSPWRGRSTPFPPKGRGTTAPGLTRGRSWRSTTSRAPWRA